jgi:hypothetical protein
LNPGLEIEPVDGPVAENIPVVVGEVDSEPQLNAVSASDVARPGSLPPLNLISYLSCSCALQEGAEVEAGEAPVSEDGETPRTGVNLVSTAVAGSVGASGVGIPVRAGDYLPGLHVAARTTESLFAEEAARHCHQSPLVSAIVDSDQWDNLASVENLDLRDTTMNGKEDEKFTGEGLDSYGTYKMQKREAYGALQSNRNRNTMAPTLMYFKTLFMKGIQVPSTAYDKLNPNLEFLEEAFFLAVRRYIEYHPDGMVDAVLKLNDDDAKSGNAIRILQPVFRTFRRAFYDLNPNEVPVHVTYVAAPGGGAGLQQVTDRRDAQAQSNFETVAAELRMPVHANNAIRPANYQDYVYQTVAVCSEAAVLMAARHFVDEQNVALKPPEFVDLWFAVCDALFATPSCRDTVTFANCSADYGESPVGYAARLQHSFQLAGNLGHIDMQNKFLVNLDRILPGLKYETIQTLIAANVNPPWNLSQMRNAAQRQYDAKAIVASSDPSLLLHAGNTGGNNHQRPKQKQTAATTLTDIMATIQPAHALSVHTAPTPAAHLAQASTHLAQPLQYTYPMQQYVASHTANAATQPLQGIMHYVPQHVPGPAAPQPQAASTAVASTSAPAASTPPNAYGRSYDTCKFCRRGHGPICWAKNPDAMQRVLGRHHWPEDDDPQVKDVYAQSCEKLGLVPAFLSKGNIKAYMREYRAQRDANTGVRTTAAVSFVSAERGGGNDAHQKLMALMAVEPQSDSLEGQDEESAQLVSEMNLADTMQQTHPTPTGIDALLCNARVDEVMSTCGTPKRNFDVVEGRQVLPELLVGALTKQQQGEVLEYLQHKLNDSRTDNVKQSVATQIKSTDGVEESINCADAIIRDRVVDVANEMTEHEGVAAVSTKVHSFVPSAVIPPRIASISTGMHDETGPNNNGTRHLSTDVNREAARIQMFKQMKGSFVTSIAADSQVQKVELQQLAVLPETDPLRATVLAAVAAGKYSVALKPHEESQQLLVIQDQQVYVRLHEAADVHAPQAHHAGALNNTEQCEHEIHARAAELKGLYQALNDEVTLNTKKRKAVEQDAELSSAFEMPQSHALADLRKGPYTCIYLDQGRTSLGVTIGTNQRGQEAEHVQQFLPDKVMIDTGANLVLVDEVCAKAAKLKIEGHRGPVASSMGGEGYTVGVARSVPMTLAMGTPWETTIRVDMHVARGVHDLYDLLLGTPFIYQVGAFADPIKQRMYFRPLLPKVLNEQSVGQLNFLPLKRNPSFVSATSVVTCFYPSDNRRCEEGDDARSDVSVSSFDEHFVCGGYMDGTF